MSHWYAQLPDGTVEARHYVPMTKDPEQTRPTRITDVRKWIKNGEKVAPSVTTIQGVLDKPALVNWQIDRHLDQAFNMAHGYSLDEYKAEVKRLASEEMEKAPQAGTDFHEEMESIIKLCQENDVALFEEETLSVKVLNFIIEKTGKGVKNWQSEINVFSSLGYSGQCDLFIPGETPYVIDFKTKQFAGKFKPKRMAYWDSHLSQLMAYGMELDPSSQFTPVNIFVCLETGEIDWHEWEKEDQKTKAWNYFLAALNVFQIKNEL